MRRTRRRTVPAERVATRSARVAGRVLLQLLIYEADNGEARLSYDLPSTLMSRFGNADLDAAARKLDKKLVAFAAEVTGAAPWFRRDPVNGLTEALREAAEIAHAGRENIGHRACKHQIAAMTGARDQPAHSGYTRTHQTAVVIQPFVAHRIEFVHRDHMRR